jgi:hypothetical protein
MSKIVKLKRKSTSSTDPFMKELTERMIRIRETISKINQIMNELKEKTR